MKNEETDKIGERGEAEIEVFQNLNDEWIKNFEKTDKLYQDFYKDDIYYINLHFVYANKYSEIDKILHETFLMSTPNFITREEVIGILKKKSTDNNTRYTLLSILKYNITLDAEEIRGFLINTKRDKWYKEFLIPIKNIDTIKFERTIHMFQDLNDLIFIFYEKTNDIQKGTQKNTNNLTKKIVLHNAHKKTIRK
jgi:hypothetical protein